MPLAKICYISQEENKRHNKVIKRWNSSMYCLKETT